MDRVRFLKRLTATSGLLVAPLIEAEASNPAAAAPFVKAPRVRLGETAANTSPAGSTVSKEVIDTAVASIHKLGLKTKMSNVGSRWGYLDGRDTERRTVESAVV